MPKVNPTDKRLEKKILDVCCGGRMFWFNKSNPDVLFVDKRIFKKQIIWTGEKSSRSFEVKPDMVMDFRKLDLPDNSFHLVVFDPPHIMENKRKSGWMRKKYGALDPAKWQEDISKGFAECFRVLKPNGTLVFKWSESVITVKEVLKLTPHRPLFGHPSGKAQGTHWICFMKTDEALDAIRALRNKK